MGSASASTTLWRVNVGPIARIITCFGMLPVMMKPPMPTLSPVCTRIRVERLITFDVDVGLGVGVGGGAAVGVGAGVVIGVGVWVVTGAAVAVAVAVADGVVVAVGVGEGVAGG